jgi:hypothetical protein
MTWSLWGIRTAISLALGSLVAWGISFAVADYVSDKYATGLTTSVETLTTNLSDLNQTVTQINTNLTQQLISLERDRAELAIEIAREVQKLQGDQDTQAKDIAIMTDTLSRIESSLSKIQSSLRIRFTVDGGKTFETFDANSAAAMRSVIEAYGFSNSTDSFVVAPFAVTPKK